MTKQNIKITCYFAIVTFLFLRIPIFHLKVITAISYSVSAAALFDIFYDRVLWRYNPFEKTPRIYGTYSEQCVSTFENGYQYTAKAVITQTLSSVTVYEEIDNSGYAESITSRLVPPSTPDGKWKLYYTYLTHPAVKESDDMHEGTVILQVKDKTTLEGTYFTNRLVPTKGNQRLIKISNRTK